jgi:hypothetical protein
MIEEPVPRQWKFIALYMVIAYLVFVICIQIAKHEVDADMNRAEQSKTN